MKRFNNEIQRILLVTRYTHYNCRLGSFNLMELSIKLLWRELKGSLMIHNCIILIMTNVVLSTKFWCFVGVNLFVCVPYVMLQNKQIKWYEIGHTQKGYRIVSLNNNNGYFNLMESFIKLLWRERKGSLMIHNCLILIMTKSLSVL